jgi:hypothetical protein
VHEGRAREPWQELDIAARALVAHLEAMQALADAVPPAKLRLYLEQATTLGHRVIELIRLAHFVDPPPPPPLRPPHRTV